MEESIYNYVNKFPQFKLDISKISNDLSDKYKSDCQKFTDDKLQNYSDKIDTFLNTCAKIVHHLEEKKREDEFKPAFFKYINYWFYDTLEDIDPFSKKELLNAFYDKIEKLNDCKTYKKHMNKEIYNGFKELHKLYDHFNEYKTESIKEPEPSCGKGDECAELYELYVRKCRWMHNPDYCTSLKKFSEEYETHRTKENKCIDSMQYLTPVGYNPVANFLNATLAMSIISFVFIYFYKFTSFGSWLRPRLPGGKNKTKKLEKKMQELQNTPDIRNSRYKLPYHSSNS